MSMLSKQVKELREMSIRQRNNAKVSGKVFFEIENALSEAADTIEALSVKLQAANMENGGGWIACEDRLPTKEECGDLGRNFNVTVIENELKTMTMKFVYETARGKEVCRWKWYDRISPWKVIAWKPLPEPYRP